MKPQSSSEPIKEINIFSQYSPVFGNCFYDLIKFFGLLFECPCVSFEVFNGARYISTAKDNDYGLLQSLAVQRKSLQDKDFAMIHFLIHIRWGIHILCLNLKKNTQKSGWYHYSKLYISFSTANNVKNN